MWLNLVELPVWDRKVGGSNPLIQTAILYDCRDARVRARIMEAEMAGQGYATGGLVQGPTSKVVHKAHGNSAGLKPQDGATVGGAPGPNTVPTKKVANPNGNTPMGNQGQNAHSGIGAGPGKQGVHKR